MEGFYPESKYVQHFCSSCEKIILLTVSLCCIHACTVSVSLIENGNCKLLSLTSRTVFKACDVGCSSPQVFPDNFMRREVMGSVVHCPFMDDGCKWKGEVRHLEVCG